MNKFHDAVVEFSGFTNIRKPTRRKQPKLDLPRSITEAQAEEIITRHFVPAVFYRRTATSAGPSPPARAGEGTAGKYTCLDALMHPRTRKLSVVDTDQYLPLFAHDRRLDNHHGIFMALLDHTSGATFDPDIEVGCARRVSSGRSVAMMPATMGRTQMPVQGSP